MPLSHCPETFDGIITQAQAAINPKERRHQNQDQERCQGKSETETVGDRVSVLQLKAGQVYDRPAVGTVIVVTIGEEQEVGWLRDPDAVRDW